MTTLFNNADNQDNSLSDQNFDTLEEKFHRKIYGGLKGDIRLAVLKKDLSEFCARSFLFSDVPSGQAPLNVLDAGGGYGPFSIHLAEMGHKLTLCDISEKMLEKAKAEFAKKDLAIVPEFLHCPIQKLDKNHKNKYDLVLCHAVLEWVQTPKDILSHLYEYLKADGILSLTFYNINGMIFKNLLRTNYKKILKQDYTGWPGSLTPTHPLESEQVLSWLKQLKFEILCHSGIRVFHDYILDLVDKNKSPQTVLDLEVQFSRKKPFRDMGRYQHILCKK
ncbi:MAG: methyltransferase domain-containing protein [Proteobacteria bacterium]|nr:methyltransferase domain-containing protein [Pseudomonadota bacterium]MBU1389177.1 methyltransferase domain-containing protein [Pseudomonadota bacterium]MBU1543401.1 methyltransferase domain-containing protein [Pseudomonadota bacterium]MBU2430048.1 methyltransferase domain-containing protein [Pseudomonadota bacterium]MBU2482904.1 methyltransferase domain-containing protein [Pseudomonadota bacterium]